MTALTAGKVLIDTNILVYAYDVNEPVKKGRAVAVLEALIQSRRGLLSSQILGEFCTVALRKLKPPLTVGEAYRSAQHYYECIPIIDISAQIVLEAIRGVRDHSLSFSDSQIWATARLNQVQTIYSEDFSDGSMVEGVQFINPLTDHFRL